eukprot:1939834-Prorocentrum_lima.AAC.1
MLAYKLCGMRNALCGMRNADNNFIPKLTQLTSATLAPVAERCSMSKRANASSTVPFGLRWKLLYSTAIRAT